MNYINKRNGVIAAIANKPSPATIRDNIHVTGRCGICSFHYIHAQVTQEAKLRTGSLHENLSLIIWPLHHYIVFCNDMRLHPQCSV